MKKTTIDSIVKLPLEIPVEITGRSKREPDLKTSIPKSDSKKEETEDITNLKKIESILYPNGYIKYPAYDFF
jgi:hypothetical protein